MPRKPKNNKPVDPSLAEIPPELINQLVSGPLTAESLKAMFRQLKKGRHRAGGGSVQPS